VRAGRISKRLDGAEQILVVSTNPALLGNAPRAEESDRDGFEKVAFLGQVPVHVRGAVRSGDFIVPSGQGDGTAIAVAPESISARHLDQVLGRSWEAAEGEACTS
jgi:hypothetical protein